MGGTLRQVFITVAYIQSLNNFYPAMWSVLLPAVAPLSFSLVQLSPSLPCVNKYTVHTVCLQCMGGGGRVLWWKPCSARVLHPFSDQQCAIVPCQHLHDVTVAIHACQQFRHGSAGKLFLMDSDRINSPTVCVWDLADWWERLTANAEVATVQS